MRGLKVFLAMALCAVVWPAHADDEKDARDIIVEGRRDPMVLQDGEWSVLVSRAYHFGDNLDGTSGAAATGHDKRWRFCLPAASVESFVRLLVGDGLSRSAGTTQCRPLQVKLADGKLRATQACWGGNITSPGTQAEPARTDAMRIDLAVTGHYAATALRLEFESRRERLTPPLEIGASTGKPIAKPDVLRWTISGERQGECTRASSSPTAPAF